MPTTELTLFVVSKDEWDTKEGPGKVHEECIAYTPLGLNRCQTAFDLRKSEGISQSIR